MKRDRVMHKCRQIMAHVAEYVVEGEDTIHREVLQTVYEREMGWADERTHRRWTGILVRHGYLAKKNDLVFHIVDRKRKTIETFGAPKVEVEGKK